MAGAHGLNAGLRRVIQGAAVGAAGAIIALALWLPHALDLFEAKTWDVRARLFARPGKETSQVVTILLDQKSLDWGKDVNGLTWPWPRELYGIIADFCRRGGAKALIVDVLYTEPSSNGVEDDQRFAAGLAGNGAVVAAMQLSAEKGKGAVAAWPEGLPVSGLQIEGLEQWLASCTPRSIVFQSVQPPIAELYPAVRFFANTNLPADPTDGVYRREPLFAVFDGKVVPSEALAAWQVGRAGAAALSIQPGRLAVGDLVVPIDSDGRAILRYRGPTLTHANHNAAEVLQAAQQIAEGQTPALLPDAFKDKYVLFGFTATGLFDLKPTPMGGLYPGVEVNATMLDNLLSGDFMRPSSTASTVLLLLALCIGAGVAVSSVSRVGWSILIYVAFLPLAPALGFAAYGMGYWLQTVALELGVVVSLVGASLASYATEGQQKRYLKGAFKQYLSPAVIEQLIAHPERLTLGGERRELTIFFSDVQGFTTISEKLSPEDLTTLLNEYLSAMTDIIQEEGGTIDKYEGDAIIAFWNAPLPQDDHAVRGVRAALRCQAKLAEMRPGFRARIGKDMLMRVGMNSGPAVVGNMGSKTRFDYTMLGDQVNLAARLEGINKQFGTYTMISAAVVQKIAGAFPARELSRVAVVGRKEPVTVYEPMLPEERAARGQALEVFDRGLKEFYAGRFAEARRIFDGISAVDPAAASYIRKCQALESSPPSEAWNGVWVMTEK